ncbi:hypothetical protein SI65_03596 [Aspergillus cristatus]|uniref:GPI inositol-deacylase winged helix domain-containing protein n=1 Tax=Aspergillus cristatus TaxID=573508 RepID=A0A1E3BHV1_ASPCR|nr:hypothetical protein SI65_03596 [Aspergillus cristatus]
MFVRKSPSLLEFVTQHILEATEGMFLLASLYIESLKSKPSVTAIKRAVENLRGGSGAYNNAYQTIMERIDSQNVDQRELANKALMWLACAKRQLTLTELQYALAIELGSSEFDEENRPDISILISACAKLAAYDEQSHIIRLVHYTTLHKKYFQETWTHWFPGAHTYIADMHYLSEL